MTARSDLTVVLLASGGVVPDALAAMPAAHARGGVLLLVAADDLDSGPATRGFLQAAGEGVAVTVVGGDAAVTARVAEQIRTPTGVR